MAVKAPSPPTPPTPPTVPGVTLSEGGSVTQSNAPPANGTTSKSTDNEKQMEEQAREAVASGSGGLSRTTQKNPAAEAQAAKAAAKEAQQSGQSQAQATIDTGRSQAAQAANLGSAGAVPQDTGSGKAVPGQEAEAAALQPDPAPKFDYHGLTYWLPMLLVAFAAAALLVKKFLHRQGRKGELTKADIEADALGAVESRELRGLTPDEVLARLDAQGEPAKVEAARTQVAKAKIKQSYSQKPKPKAKAAPKKPPKTKAGPRKTTQEEERQRFEVRI